MLDATLSYHTAVWNFMFLHFLNPSLNPTGWCWTGVVKAEPEPGRTRTTVLSLWFILTDDKDVPAETSAEGTTDSSALHSLDIVWHSNYPDEVSADSTKTIMVMVGAGGESKRKSLKITTWLFNLRPLLSVTTLPGATRGQHVVRAIKSWGLAPQTKQMKEGRREKKRLKWPKMSYSHLELLSDPDWQQFTFLCLMLPHTPQPPTLPQPIPIWQHRIVYLWRSISGLVSASSL